MDMIVTSNIEAPAFKKAAVRDIDPTMCQLVQQELKKRVRQTTNTRKVNHQTITGYELKNCQTTVTVVAKANYLNFFFNRFGFVTSAISSPLAKDLLAPLPTSLAASFWTSMVVLTYLLIPVTLTGK